MNLPGEDTSSIACVSHIRETHTAVQMKSCFVSAISIYGKRCGLEYVQYDHVKTISLIYQLFAGVVVLIQNGRFRIQKLVVLDAMPMGCWVYRDMIQHISRSQTVIRIPTLEG